MNKNIIRVISAVFALVLLIGVCALPVSAADVSPEAEKVIALIKKLPIDAKTVTVDNKADIVAAKLAYNELTPDQKLEISTDYLVILNGDYSAVMPYILANLVNTMKTLPDADEIKESEKDNIISLYIDYQLLDDTAKGAFSANHKEKLLSAVSRFAPDELTEEDAETIKTLIEKREQKEKEQKEKEAAAKAQKKKAIENVLKYGLVIFMALIILCSLVAMIILIIKLVKL